MLTGSLVFNTDIVDLRIEGSNNWLYDNRIFIHILRDGSEEEGGPVVMKAEVPDFGKGKGLKGLQKGTRYFKDRKPIEITKQANDIIRTSIKRAKEASKGLESGRHGTWAKRAARDLLEQAKISKQRGDLPELYQPLFKKSEELLKRAKGINHKSQR